MHDKILAPAEDESPNTLAVLDVEPENAPGVDTWTGARCEKCDAPIASDVVTICSRCGWYPSLSAFVEIDPNWESEQDAPQAVEPHAQQLHAKVWLAMMPWWGWVILASVLAVVVQSVIVRLVTPAGTGGLRTSWSLAQLTLGVLLVAGCHIFNFVVQAAEDADIGAADIVVRPIKVWLRAVNRLPSKLWVVNTAACGLTAIVMSLLVIGAIPYDRLWDWGFSPPPKQDLMGAVMDRAKKMGGPGSDNLEDAVGDFAGRGGVDGESPQKPPPPKRQITDCVIIGYRIDNDGRLTELLLGTAHLGKLVYAGTVAAPNDIDEATRLLQLLVGARSHQRFLPLETEAIWVAPKHACRATFTERRPDGRLLDAQWETYLAELRM